MAAQAITTASTESSQVVRQGQSYTDFLAAIEEYPRHRIEFIEGTLYMTPSPAFRHQIASMNLSGLLWTYVGANQLGIVVAAPMDVELAQGRVVVQPDIFFVAQERRAMIQENRVVGAPDLVVEILSPATARLDRVRKLTEYARAHVREYWIVDPDERVIFIHTLDGNAYLIAGVFVPGDVIDVGQFAQAKIKVDAIFGV